MLSLVNTTEEEVVEFFCRHPTGEYSVSDVSRQLGYSKPSISQSFDTLNRQGVLKIEEKRNSKLATFKRGENAALKQLINLNQLRTSGLITQIVDDYEYPEAIVLFGSYAKGEDTENSDIDIAVISTEKTEQKYKKLMGRKISITNFEPGKVPENMMETLANGITLYGYLGTSNSE